MERQNSSMHTLEQKQILPLSLEKAWKFFSDPRNLGKITPPEMGFDILQSDLPDEIYPGMLIAYRVKPLFNIPMTWVTEITHVHAPYFFVDNQKAGPYAFWHHQHHFRKVTGGIEMIDQLSYKVPIGFFGDLLAGRFIDRKVREIFEFRRAKLQALFPVQQ